MIKGIGPAFLFLNGFEDYFGFFGIVPETGGKGYFFFFGDQLQFAVDVKGTSSALRAALIVLLWYQWLSWDSICVVNESNKEIEEIRQSEAREPEF